jgi:hypothetical protein
LKGEESIRTQRTRNKEDSEEKEDVDNKEDSREDFQDAFIEKLTPAKISIN